MTDLTVRDLPDDVAAELRARAAEHGRSVEAEAREALTSLYAPRPVPRNREEFLERLRQAQAIVRSRVPPGVSLVDELLAERRWEVACEQAEMDGTPKPPRSDFVRDG